MTKPASLAQHIPVLQVVSNLQSQWYMLWMDNIDIHRCCFATRAYAAKVINDVLAGRMDPQPVSVGQGDSEPLVMRRRRIAEELAPNSGSA